MEDKFSKMWTVLNVVHKVATALDGISNELKRFNDLKEYSLGLDNNGNFDMSDKNASLKANIYFGNRADQNSRKTRSANGRVPDILYDSILAISKEKSEFLAREVINLAMESRPNCYQKQSLNTALQGFKIGSKTAKRQPLKCRDLIVPVDGHRGLYRLNPEKKPLSDEND